MNGFHTADCVLGAVTLVAAILGLFGGFSGALGFCAGVVAAGVSVKFGYPLACGYVAARWGAVLVTLALTLLAFGLARAVVRRIVKGLLAQPADAIFGFLVAGLTGAGLATAALVLADRMGARFDSVAVRFALDFLGG